jgi:heme-binding NEAT domain protein
MMQLYSKKSSDLQMQPNKETVQFLINFSKSLRIVKTKSKDFIELNLN